MEYGFGDGTTYDVTGNNSFRPQNAFTRPGKEYKQDLEQRWLQYENDPMSLGMSQAEMDQVTARAQQQAMAGQQAAITELNRGALGGQAFQAGAMADTAQKLTDQGSEAAAKASSSVNDLNQKLIEQRISQLRADMMGQRNHNEQLTQDYTGLAVDTIMGLIEAFAPTGA